MFPPFGHRPLASSSAIMTRSGLRPARIHGRGDRAPPRKPLCALSQGFPRKATSPWLAPRRGGLCTPEGKTLAPPGHVPARPPAVRSPLGDHTIPPACLRPCHPGAETAPLRENHPARYFRALPARPPPPGSSPGRGGLCTLEVKALAPAGHVPARPPAVRLPLHDHVMLRLVSGPFCGRTECAPPRKPPFTLSLSLPGKPFYGRLAIWRRGGLRTPEKASLGMIHTLAKGRTNPPLLQFARVRSQAIPRDPSTLANPRPCV